MLLKPSVERQNPTLIALLQRQTLPEPNELGAFFCGPHTRRRPCKDSTPYFSTIPDSGDILFSFRRFFAIDTIPRCYRAGRSTASNDPSWGQGLSLSFRDARVLSDELRANDDWNAAGNSYAARYDDHYGMVSKVSGWFYDVFQRLGPEAEARRARALPLFAQDPTRLPDTLFSGPDVPLAADARNRFFGGEEESGSDTAIAASS